MPREYFPAFLGAFIGKLGGVSSPVAQAVLAIAPTPCQAAKSSTTRIVTAVN
ncbi:hypothetical protein [Umezawaea tangerina]|uniref:hypothetical protein n=1 Tax=Umezawaea tangerina TaxID=84725 RepID=UPI00147301FD|nr:hypothetical protein [Umezawaea tangerina]